MLSTSADADGLGLLMLLICWSASRVGKRNCFGIATAYEWVPVDEYTYNWLPSITFLAALKLCRYCDALSLNVGSVRRWNQLNTFPFGD